MRGAMIPEAGPMRGLRLRGPPVKLPGLCTNPTARRSGKCTGRLRGTPA